MTLSRQQIACRRNGSLGGPKTEEGKGVCRHNARKHGIWVSALSHLDKGDLRKLHEWFAAEMQPEGPVEETLVERIALTYLRMVRCARAEAAYHCAAWRRRSPGRLSAILHIPTDLRPRQFEKIALLINRYDSSLSNQFLKLLHELERRQRRRAGEQVRPPALTLLDVNAD
ncbi:MAG: hypothetical protein ACYS8K_06770 [Planctomycetota bacterium]|jgi:hypothetical protein